VITSRVKSVWCISDAKSFYNSTLDYCSSRAVCYPYVIFVLVSFFLILMTNLSPSINNLYSHIKNQLLSIKKILLLCPIEQFDFTLEDIREIVSNSSVILTDEWIQGVRKESEERNSHQDDVANRNTSTKNSFASVLQKTLWSTYCKMNDDKYDNLNTSNTGITGSCCVIMCSDEEYSIYVTRKHYSNAKKGMAGSWIGTFNLLLSSSEGNADDSSSSVKDRHSNACTISGSVQLKAHVNENDNVQMTSTVTLDSTNVVFASGDNEQVVAKAVANQLLLWDKEIFLSLTEFYDSMENTVLRSSRRILPHSRKRMDWDVKSHRVVSNLHNFNI